MENQRQNQTVQDFESTGLYRAVFQYVQAYMSRYDASHDFNHILRVLAMSKHILATEQSKDHAKPPHYHQPSVVLAALLHDVGDKKYAQPGEDADRLIEDLLTKNGASASLAADVARIAKNVSFSNEVKNPAQVKEVLSIHPELAIVQDADRLDAIGAVGIARTFAFGAVKQSDRGLQGSIEHFVEKLENLESMMKTDTGRALAQERTRRLKEFRGWWEEEQQFLS